MPDNKDSKDTTSRVSTGFWGLIDEVKDDIVGMVKKYLPFGLGAAFLLPMLLTKQGREMIGEFAQFARLKYGEQMAAITQDWAMRAYKHARNSILTMVGVLIVFGLYGLLKITEQPEIGVRFQLMFWNLLAVSLVLMFSYGRLMPLMATLAAAAGVIGSIKEVDWKLLTKLPAFLASGGKSGVAWLDSLWRIDTRIGMMYGIGAIWLMATPIHNDPYLKYLAGLMILTIFFTHMAYKPGDRGNFWWWVNWSMAIMAIDVTLWCMFPVLKVVYNLGVTEVYLGGHPQYAQLNQWLGENEWYRVGATVLGAALLIWQGAISIKLARGTARGGASEQLVPVYPTSGPVYRRAAPFANNNLGWIISGVIVCFLIVAYMFVATNGALPGYPKAAPGLTERYEYNKALRDQNAAANDLGKAQAKMQAANLKVDSTQQRLESQTEFPDANH